MKKAWIILVVFMMIFVNSSYTVHADERSYTYTFDYFSVERESPDAYRATQMFSGIDLGIESFKNPTALFVKENDLYVCDTGNNRIVVLTKQDGTFVWKEEIKEVTGDTNITTLAGPTDIYVNEEGEKYICDKQNQRILYINAQNEVLFEYTKPVDETIAVDAQFFPEKVLADNTGRVIALVEGYNKGFLQMSKEGEFIGYLGASKVKVNPLDLLWKSIATQEQRAQMELFVPTEYNNMAFDQEGFIYATTDVFDVQELNSGSAQAIRKLNTMGNDILIRNGVTTPVGDVTWSAAGDIDDCSRFSDITILDNNVYCALDYTRGKIFAYDYQGNLLYAFGGVGNRKGYFQNAISIEHMGNQLLVLDGKSGYITTFDLTEYGKLIQSAMNEYMSGDYDLSGAYWEEVIALNGNYDLAYIGLGRALTNQGEYEEAMEYFKAKRDDVNYSKAFKLYRKEWIEENISWIMIACIALWGVNTTRKIAKKVKTGWLSDEMD